MVKIIYGDLIQAAIDGDIEVVVHGCNCFNTMGKGFAKAIATTVPEAALADKKTVKGDRDKLGSYTTAQSKDHNFMVVNAYTQFGYGTGQKHLDEDALKTALMKVKENFEGKKIGMPKIGCDNAGGDWEEVKKIIASIFTQEDDVGLYLLG